MKLARKLTLPLSVAIFLVLTLGAVISVRRELALFGEDAQRDHHLVGTVLSLAAERELIRNGGDFHAVMQVVRAADERDPSVHASFSPIDLISPSEREVLERNQEVNQLDWSEFVIVTLMPVRFEGKTVGAVQLAEPLDEEKQFVRQTVEVVGGAAVLLSLFGALLALSLGRWIVGSPMRLLAERAREIGEGRHGAPLVLKQRDEIGELAADFNKMAEQLEAARKARDLEQVGRLAALEQLRHADRLATIGKLSSGIAHELGTPLNVIHARARMIASGEAEGEEAKANARVMVAESEHITHIIRQLLDFARRRVPVKREEDVAELSAETLRLLETLAKNAQVNVEAQTGQPVIAQVDRQQVQQVLTNLVVNAIQATGKDGRVALKVSRERRAPPPDVGGVEAEFARIEVSDTGSGIPSEVLPHIFEPFFTTKGVGEGTGLGLSVAWGLARDHGGWIGVESREGQGSRFSLFLPAAT